MKRKDLVIVESKRKAERLAAILGPGYTVMSCPQPPRSLVQVDRQTMAETYEVPETMVFVACSLKEAARRAGSIILATEPDREGEALAWQISEVLPVYLRDKVHRAILPIIEEEAIIEEIDIGHPLDMDRIQAWRAGQVIDRLVADALTPLLKRWKLVDDQFNLDRVSLTTLRLLVEREWNRLSQPADQRWNVRVQLNAHDRLFWAELDQDDLCSSEQEALGLIELLTQSGTGWQVERVEQREVTEKPLPPFTHSALVQDAARQLWLTPDEVEAPARELYDTGLITYHRTTSTQVDPEITMLDLWVLDDACGEKLVVDLNIEGQLEAGEIGAIRPIELGQSLMKETDLSDATRTVYNRIWLRYVASLLCPAKTRLQEIVIRPTWTGSVETWEDEQTHRHPFTFRAELCDPVEMGWKALYPWPKSAQFEIDNERIIPALSEGDSVEVEALSSSELEDHLERYSVVALLEELESLRISRPHTICAAVERLLDQDYARLEEDRLIPTPKGEDVVFLVTMHLSEVLDPAFIAGLEDKLDRVAVGETSREQVLAAFDERFAPAAKDVRRALLEPVEEDLPVPTLRKEPA